VNSLHRLEGESVDYDVLLDETRAARFVLIGEASHGTHQFYAERAELTKRLIAEQGIAAVAVEGDWPDAYRVNVFVRGESDDATPEEALADFRRFPAWMWRNTVVSEFVAWLRDWNDALPRGASKVGLLRARPLQPARVAGRYDRAMFRGGGAVTWNLRDRHMADTLDALVDHLEGTHSGTVTAASNWGGVAERTRRAHGPAPRVRNRRHLPARDGADLPLLRRGARAAVRRRRSHRRDARPRAARADERVGGRRAAGDVSLRGLERITARLRG
jgi:Erythromycin esterase